MVSDPLRGVFGESEGFALLRSGLENWAVASVGGHGWSV